MIATVFHDPDKIEVTEVARPSIGPDEILGRVGANTLCGTDVRALNGERRPAASTALPSWGMSSPVTWLSSAGW